MSLEHDVTYLVESDRDATVLLAIDPKVGDRAIEWFDTCHDRAFEPVHVEKTEDGLRFQTSEAKYSLRKLTVDLYNYKVAGQVTGGLVFQSTDAIQQFYRQFPR